MPSIRTKNKQYFHKKKSLTRNEWISMLYTFDEWW